MRRLLLATALVVLLLVAVPMAAFQIRLPDASAPEPVDRILVDAKRYLAGQLDLPVAHIRYVGLETRDVDDLVVLEFELRSFPWVAAEGAYLVSRCTPLEELDVFGMGGGRGVEDFDTDPELRHLRSDAQPPCPG
jgi:hypothetical protein